MTFAELVAPKDAKGANLWVRRGGLMILRRRSGLARRRERPSAGAPVRAAAPDANTRWPVGTGMTIGGIDALALPLRNNTR